MAKPGMSQIGILQVSAKVVFQQLFDQKRGFMKMLLARTMPTWMMSIQTMSTSARWTLALPPHHLLVSVQVRKAT